MPSPYRGPAGLSDETTTAPTGAATAGVLLLLTAGIARFLARPTFDDDRVELAILMGLVLAAAMSGSRRSGRSGCPRPETRLRHQERSR